MGIYFTVFYIGMVAGPLLGGLVAAVMENSAATFYFGALLVLGACVCVWLFVRLADAIATAPRAACAQPAAS